LEAVCKELLLHINPKLHFSSPLQKCLQKNLFKLNSKWHALPKKINRLIFFTRSNFGYFEFFGAKTHQYIFYLLKSLVRKANKDMKK
jgi:hypothetical protein